MTSSSLTARFLEGDERALARAITLLESGRPQGQALLREVRARANRARIVGITGSPGSGKSTLSDRLIGKIRERDQRVAVVAVDPTSPYSGGAILGDRIRMLRWHQDRSVYIRSMATRGHLGGLAAASLQVVALLDAYGFDYVLIETVGVGQSEVDIVKVADTTVLVMTPGQGDGVQAFKAGIMEIADVFAVNKFDQAGGPRLLRELKAALELGHPEEGEWWPAIQATTAATGEGLDELMTHLDKHHEHLTASSELDEIRRGRARFEIAAIVHERIRQQTEAQEGELIEAVLRGELEPGEAARKVLESF
jgi:LAO/AO transport system kinase